MRDWSQPGAYQTTGSCGHPSTSSNEMCDDCIKALPKLSDDAVLRGVPALVRRRTLQPRRV